VKLESVNVAAAQPMTINGGEVMTGIRKRSVAGRVAVGPLNLAGDEQADPSVHGGLSKAVYAYPSEHYAFWQTVRAQAGLTAPEPAPRDAPLADWSSAVQALPPGMLGENLTLSGLLESDVCIGDVLRFPDCVLAVSEPRFPCFKFNAVMGFAQASKLMAQSAWCGFYLAVRVPGTLAAGESFELVPGPREVGIVELFRARAASKRY